MIIQEVEEFTWWFNLSGKWQVVEDIVQKLSAEWLQQKVCSIKTKICSLLNNQSGGVEESLTNLYIVFHNTGVNHGQLGKEKIFQLLKPEVSWVVRQNNEEAFWRAGGDTQASSSS